MIILYCIIFLILLFVIINLIYTRPTCEGYSKVFPTWIVILTTAVNNDPIREQLYKTQIMKWLYLTNLPIFVIESSNNHFMSDIDHPNLFFYTFKLDHRFDKRTSSIKEAMSLDYLMSMIKTNSHYQSCTHILKVTGRYFLNGIENELSTIQCDCDLYLQQHRNIFISQHSEYFGIRKNLLQILVNNIIARDVLMEHELFTFSNQYKWQYIGPFKNNIRRGGDKKLISQL